MPLRVSTNSPGRRAPLYHGPETIVRLNKLPPLTRPPRKVLPTPAPRMVPDVVLVPDELYAQFRGALREGSGR